MANLEFTFVVQDDGSAVVKRFGSNVERVGKRAKVSAAGISGAFRGLRRTLLGLPTLIGAVGASIAVIGTFRVLKSIIDVGDRVEQARLALIGLKGGVDEANAAFENFQRIASKVPFTLDEIIQGGVQLEAFGANSEKVLQDVVDLAAFMQTSVPEAAQAFGRAFAAGAGAADILRDKGVLTLVSLRTGIDDLTKLSLPNFRKALISAFRDSTGPIAGAAERLADTFTGKLSQIEDAILKFQQQLAEEGLLDVAKEQADELTIALNALTEAFDPRAVNEMAESMTDFILPAETLVKIITQLGVVLTNSIILAAQFAKAFFITIRFIKELGAGIALIFANVAFVFTELTLTIKKFLQDVLAKSIIFVGDKIEKLGVALSAIPGVEGKVTKATEELGRAMTAFGGDAAEVIIDVSALTKASDALAKVSNDAAEFIEKEDETVKALNKTIEKQIEIQGQLLNIQEVAANIAIVRKKQIEDEKRAREESAENAFDVNRIIAAFENEETRQLEENLARRIAARVEAGEDELELEILREEQIKTFRAEQNLLLQENMNLVEEITGVHFDRRLQQMVDFGTRQNALVKKIDDSSLSQTAKNLKVTETLVRRLEC